MMATMIRSKGNAFFQYTFFPILCIGVGVVFFAWGAHMVYMNGRFSRSDVVHVTGTVTDASTRSSYYPGRHAGRYLYSASLSYRFQDSEGQEIDSSEAVAGQDYNRYGPRGQVPVEYLLHSPWFNRLYLPDEETGGWIWGWGFMILGLGLGGPYWYLYLIRAKRMHHALERI